ncbi:MAG: hypothetical protein ACRDUA_15055, partial [Micromonosporaceae bacterium]
MTIDSVLVVADVRFGEPRTCPVRRSRIAQAHQPLTSRVTFGLGRVDRFEAPSDDGAELVVSGSPGADRGAATEPRGLGRGAVVPESWPDSSGAGCSAVRL